MGKHPGHEFSPQTPRSPILPSIPPLVLCIISMYKKAFDLVDQKKLLAKLEACGIETRDLGEYLITILRPLLIIFSIFINDLPSQIQHSTVDIYADDATLSTSFDIATGFN